MKWPTSINVRWRSEWKERHEPESLRYLTETYWRALLVITATLSAATILYGGWKFFSVLWSDGAEASVVQSGGPALDQAELEATLESFRVRQEQYELLKKSPPAIADPSK